MTTATAWPTSLPDCQTVKICCGPLAGLLGRLVSEYDRRWIIELSPGVHVSMAAINCEPIFMDSDWGPAVEA
jgi:hypothetical protein